MELFYFHKLPDHIVEDIFKSISYADVVRFRLVSKWFNYQCVNILNSSFLTLKDTVDTLIANTLKEIENVSVQDKLEKRLAKISALCLSYKIFSILKSELTVLYSICGRYIHFGVCCFTGGKILDQYKFVIHNLMRLANGFGYASEVYSNLVFHLLFLNQKFMDHFESDLEPTILKEHSLYISFGTKLIDLLDSYVHSNFNMEASFNGTSCRIYARYEILSTQFAKYPPILLFNGSSEIKNGDLIVLMKYFRNQMRWSNFFDCVNSAYVHPIFKKPLGKFCLNLDDGIKIVEKNEVIEASEGYQNCFSKIFSRWTATSPPSENICYTIEFKCSKYFAPMKLAPYIMDSSIVQHGFDRSNITFNEILRHISECYEFNLMYKIILPSSDNSISIENSLDLCQGNGSSYFSQYWKKLPL